MDYRKHKTPALFAAILFLGLCFQLPFQTLVNMPAHQRVVVGQPLNLNFSVPKALAQNFQFNIEGLKPPSFHLGQTAPVASTPGELEVQVKLFGFIPLRNMVLSVVPEIRVIPGGQAIGIMLESEGVMVVGRSAIFDEKGIEHNPAKEAGVQLGDTLLKVDGQKVENEMQVRNLINKIGGTGKPIPMEFKDKVKGQIYKVNIKPIFCSETKRYRVGLFVRDSTAGVGTMTFFHPESKSYGALGHVISDIDTGQPIDLAKGKIVGASIQGIRMGKRGHPGEKIGMFMGQSDISGIITRNTNCGIFGKVAEIPQNLYSKESIPVALAQEVAEGPAEIYTVLQGGKIEKFTIEILQVNSQAKANGKGIVLKITDSRLLAKTGGIIQGMSGSPIIQKGKLVGAVTHVFVNDPQRGYGVLAEWMLYDSGVLNKHVGERKMQEFDARANIAC